LRLLQESSANLVTILQEDMGLGHQAPAYPSVNFSKQTNIKKSPKLITVRFSTKKRITQPFPAEGVNPEVHICINQWMLESIM
jgi:hypothetical protein